jgi:hypothetical protein
MPAPLGPSDARFDPRYRVVFLFAVSSAYRSFAAERALIAVAELEA